MCTDTPMCAHTHSPCGGNICKHTLLMSDVFDKKKWVSMQGCVHAYVHTISHRVVETYVHTPSQLFGKPITIPQYNDTIY
jgi:hypothetical protein